jgi:hypothetical protein
MHNHCSTDESAKLRQSIASIDLDPIKLKLTDIHDGAGWTKELADAVEPWYRRFLYLTVKYSDRAIVPNKVIDTFWHYHILDTKKYAADCTQAFGFFVHHYPYFGMNGPEDAERLRCAFHETTQLYGVEFGGEPPRAVSPEPFIDHPRDLVPSGDASIALMFPDH